MFSKNLKKKVAVLLTGVMVLGMTVTASAAGETSGGADGKGNFEGHVNREVINVTLPTVAEGTAPFNFILDSEGLIAQTNAKAYGDNYDFEAGKYVFFKTDDKEFKSNSSTLSVSNNSSVSVNVTLKIDLTPGANDVNLVGDVSDVPNDYDPTTNPVSGDPSLFLGLVVDGNIAEHGEVYAISENSVSKTFMLGGKPGNFHVSANQVYGEDTENYPHGYSFVENDGDLTWDKLDFNLTGKANKVENADGITVPNLKVTWSFEGAGGGSTLSISASQKSVTVPEGTIKKVILNKPNAGGTAELTAGKHYSLSNSNKTLTMLSDGVITNNVGGTLTVELNEGGNVTVSIK